MTKPFHLGMAAQSGILAAELAQRGFTASPVAIEGRFGFWDVFAGALNRDGDELARVLGSPFESVSPGVNFKAWPCCASTFGGIDAALKLPRGLTDEAIECVNVEVPYMVPMLLIHHRPTAPLAAKFSLEYCVSVALLDGQVNLRHFLQETVDRPDLQSLLRRVEYCVPAEWEKGAGPYKGGHARVEVKLRDGGILRAETMVPKGDAANPMADDELEAKFLDCAAVVLGKAQAAETLELVRSLEHLQDVRCLTEKLIPTAQSR